MSRMCSRYIARPFLALGLVLAAVQVGVTGLVAQSVTESVKDELRTFPLDKGSFSLVHRRLNEMSEADRALVASHAGDIRESAQIYGYDLAAGNWQIEQGVCPQLPHTLLLHYLDRYADGTQSLFTAIVPRDSGRVRIVAVLHRNAVPFETAVENPKSYALFNTLVSAEVAQQNSAPRGDWLEMGVCYAEMVGGRPNVPRDPTTNKATINAAPATIFVDPATGLRNIRFPDLEADRLVTMWSIAFDPHGRVVSAGYDDRTTYAAQMTHPAQVAAKPMARNNDTAGRVVASIPDPPSKILKDVPDPPAKVSNYPPEPVVKFTPDPNR